MKDRLYSANFMMNICLLLTLTYLDVTISSDLRRCQHVHNISANGKTSFYL